MIKIYRRKDWDLSVYTEGNLLAYFRYDEDTQQLIDDTACYHYMLKVPVTYVPYLEGVPERPFTELIKEMEGVVCQ